MLKRESIVPEDMRNIPGQLHYSPGVRVGNLFIAGQLGRDGDLQVVEGKEAQFTQAFENVKKVLAAAGAGFDDVVDMITFHTDMRDMELFRQVKSRYFTNPDRLPAWTGIGTTALTKPGLFVEIKCTALLPD